ncbi:hypothetical protein DL991_24765 [Amycolatopsis sp. WAC 01375]|uniref:hypothetical protein n=1 Tax=Amycolatopsis sp. WAC 01375 TaxID=2203194 RepID=UPI000F7A76BA|nr:hypothetical protein [Amycolatopsis sp. WAC 01375]RSM76432.1 hypothetical protein DL991_24765 [Amycolatopsis sp. WAC 01375]
MEYEKVNFDVQVKMFQAELQYTYPALIAAKAMWEQARTWVDDAQGLLQTANNNLRGPNWDDEVGRSFVNWVDEVSKAGLGSWGGLEQAPAPAPADAPKRPTGSITESALFLKMDALQAEMDATRSIMNAWIGRVNAKTDPDERTKEAELARAEVGGRLNQVAKQYVFTGHAMLAARGRPWNGPTQLGSGPGYNQDSGLGNGSGTPNAGDLPGEDPGTPDPTTPEQPSEQNPTSSPVEDATETLSALSDALSAAEQLLGGSGAGTPELPDLSGIDPSKLGDYADYAGYADGGTSGLPSLAGMPDTAGLSGTGGSGAGGGTGVGGGAGAIPGPGSSMPGAGLNAGAAPMVSGLGRGSASAAGAAGAGGMPPPMMPNNGAGKGENGGIKPGDAERPVGRQRGKPAGTPGVPLLGRAVNGKRKSPPAAPQRQWDPESNTVQLLDEELWQVNQQDNAAKFRSGH